MIKKVTEIFSTLIITLAGLLLISIPISVSASPHCNNLKGCEKKFCEMERQLNIAQENNNARKVDGLNKALGEAKEHCTVKNFKEDLIEKLKEVKKEIAEYESDLKDAQEYGKTDKVRKYQEKIEEEKNKIKHLEDELSNLE